MGKVSQRIEEFILALLVIIQIMDFLEILPGDLDYVKKIISWSGIGYLFYKASISGILFGNKKKILDLSIVLAYFALIVKDLIHFVNVAEDTLFLENFYQIILDNNVAIATWGIYLGFLTLVVISIYTAFNIPIKKPSLIAATREEGIPKTIPGKILRSIIILIILFSFFAIVFNLITEWLAVALDAPLVVIGIFAYLFLIIGRHKHFKTETLVYKLGEFGENFYTKFIELFHYKKTIYLGIMGMLALHLLTEVGNFIIPYLIGLKDAFYFEGLQEAGHTPLIFHYFKDIIAAQGLHKITFSLAYAFNYIAILFLLVVPAYLWYKMFKQSKFHFAKCVQSLVIASILTFLTLPMLKLEKITSQALVGVDIQTRSLETTFFINNYLPDKLLVIAITVILSLVIGIIMYILELNDKNKKRIFVTLIGIGMLFFGYYLFLFLASHLTYYLAAFKTLIALHSYILLIFIAIQALITVVFYIFGYIFFIYELSKHYRDVFSSV